MATNNQVGVGLSGSTGTGNFVGSNSPTLVTPTLGVATATTLAFNPTTGGIIGTNTNNNTTAGNVGESVISQILFASSVTFVNNTPTDLTSISLTAGDWDVWGNVVLSTLGTTTGNFQAWTSSTSATFVDQSIRYGFVNSGAIANGPGVGVCVVPQRYSLSGTSTVYITAYVASVSGDCTGCGGIYARRVR